MDRLNILSLLGLSLRGGRLAVGEEPVEAVARARDARVLLLAADAAEGTRRRCEHFAQAGDCLWLQLPFTKAELGRALGRTAVAIAAVTDVGLAAALLHRLAELDPEQYPFEIIVDTGSDDPAEADAQKQFSGYYITTNMLAKDVQAVRDSLDSLDGLTTVMIDVKSVFGYYYYSSEQPGAETADADIAAVDKLISDLTKRSGLTVIAHVPAFSDPLFAFDHQSDSLAMYSGALWMDDRRCYWMNPNSSAVQGFLSSIAIELSDLGFDEVVFDDFYFPDSEAIAWNGSVSKEDAVLNAAKSITDNMQGVNIHVSFGSSAPAMAAYAYRLYIRTDDPTQVMTVMDSMQEVMTDIPAQVVFVTSSRDTRFAQCSVLLPLLAEE